MPESGKNQPPHGSLLPFTVTGPVTSQEMSIAHGARGTKLYFARELTKSDLIFRPAPPGQKSPKPVPFETGQAQNKP